LEGDADANYAYYALHELKILPGQYMSLSREERAFIMAAIDVRVEKERKEQARAKRK